MRIETLLQYKSVNERSHFCAFSLVGYVVVVYTKRLSDLEKKRTGAYLNSSILSSFCRVHRLWIHGDISHARYAKFCEI